MPLKPRGTLFSVHLQRTKVLHVPSVLNSFCSWDFWQSCRKVLLSHKQTWRTGFGTLISVLFISSPFMNVETTCIAQCNVQLGCWTGGNCNTAKWPSAHQDEANLWCLVDTESTVVYAPACSVHSLWVVTTEPMFERSQMSYKLTSLLRCFQQSTQVWYFNA